MQSAAIEKRDKSAIPLYPTIFSKDTYAHLTYIFL